MAPLKLYYYLPAPGPNSTLLVIRSLGLEVDLHSVDLLAKEHYEEWYEKINPQRTLPSLDDNGFILNESRAISAYLVDTYKPGSSLYPKDTKQRALVDQRLYFDATTLFPRGAAIFVSFFF